MNASADIADTLTSADDIAALDALLDRAWAELPPPPPRTIAEWAEAERELSPEESAIPGRYSLDVTPSLRGILDSCSDQSVRKVVAQKSAQIGYTAGIVCNVIGYHVHHRPSVQVAVFPREKSAKDFAAEKLDPMIRATPVLAERIALKSRAAGNSITRKHYSGGLIKLVGSNSPSDVKSTSARIVIIEEPDDANQDVKGQGDSIKLAEERAKTHPDHLILIGGTPTAKGASSIEAEMAASDKRQLHVPCGGCGESHVLDWANITIPEDGPDAPAREIYARHRWEDAYYTCPHCGVVWSDDDRIASLHSARWIASADSQVHGYYLNELQSTFDGSRIPILARKYLEAQSKMDAGDPGEMVAFWNSTLGKPWEYRGELPEEDELLARAEPYAEWTCPAGGLVPLISVDVQHDRLAVTCWVVGRDEEMWLAYWGELYGQTVVTGQGAWIELAAILDKRITHAYGTTIPIAACGIDCSDGQTSDAAYAFVRRHNRADRPVLALKGASDAEGRVEIWTPPKAIDPNNRATKASRYGVQIHIVGAARAKDLILGWAQEGGRVRLTGDGAGRMHWYQSVRADFYEQLLGEIKVPSRTNHKKRQWKARTDRRNEALDCTVYAVYLVRHLRLHLRRPLHWDLAELRLRQNDLLADVAVLPVSSDPILADGEMAAVVPTAQPVDQSAEPDVSAARAAARFAELMRNRKTARHGQR